MHSDHHQSGFLNSSLSMWNVHDGGLSFISMDGSGTLENPVVEYKSQGVINTQVYAIAINPSTGSNGDFMMANQDNDGFSREAGQWVSASAGDGVACAINYSDPSIRYLGGTEGALTRSDQVQGYTGNYTGVQLNTPGNAEFIWPLSLDTTNPSKLFGGFDDMYVSTDDGDNWTALNANVGKPVSFDNQGNTIAVVGTAGLAYSNNGGTSWSTINQPESEEINSFSIDAAAPATLYATVKGYNNGNKVYKSTDSGNTWTNYSTDMPNILMKKVLLMQNQTEEYLFAATELGVYYRSPGVTSWTKLGTNLPNVIVNDMKINYMNEKLYIGTYGRGMWEINVSTNTLSKDEVIQLGEVKVFPNPVKDDLLNVNVTSNLDSVDYVIYNIVGGVINRGQLSATENTINLNQPASGMYIIKLNVGNKSITKKFMVE
ncbi:T9SS type A sorting domain-containing protein [Winogradskyella sp.]